MQRHQVATALFLVGIAAASAAAGATYEISQRESRIRFAIGHADYEKKIKGRFTTFAGTIEVPEGRPEAARVHAEVTTSSITTANRFRDSHLRTSFFEAERYPTASFEAGPLEKDGENLVLEGELTMKGVTRTVRLNVRGSGLSVDATGERILRYRAATRIDRRDFGIAEDASKSSGLKAIVAHVQEGLDHLISDHVDISLMLVAREVKE
jgi:polyisoprenoid-binding protein YceI